MEADWAGLLKGLWALTLSVAGGLALGKAIIALSLPERLFRVLLPRMKSLGIPPQALFALGVSLGSSRAGVAIVAEAYSEGIMTKQEALFGTLLQSFPGYVRRWTVTFPVAAALAGKAGAIFSLTLLTRSFIRFLFFLAMLRRPGGGERTAGTADPAGMSPSGRFSLLKTLLRTLPPAWAFYGGAYLATPALQRLIEAWGAGLPLMSPAGWTVAAASFAHVNAALGAAGGSVAVGSLTTAQAVLALLTGNMLAALSRVLRQDLAFWMGLYPGRMVRSLFAWNFGTLMALMAVSVAAAAVPVILGW